MSKAVEGAAMIAGAVVLTIATGGLGAAVITPLEISIITSLAVGGVSMELGAVASMLSPAQGLPMTVRQPAAPRQIVYGTQRVGAVEVFESTTGSSKDQFNMVLIFATHEITAIQNLYLDGRQVYWAGSGDGFSVRNGYGFGGGADGQDHIGPDGSRYNFANASSGHEGVWATARFGDQLPGDVMGELTANDPRWAADGEGNSPWLGGCAYIYLKCEYDPNVFPTKPGILATILGKPVYDPRSGQTAYSSNWALIVADIIQDPEYGFGDPINQEQLIAAANICDEQVACAAGMESRYAAHFHYTTGTPVGQVLETLMQAAGGRVSFIGGEWHIFPGTYTGPTASFGADALIDKPSWSAQRKFREKCNRVQGTFIAPNNPYNVAGNLYDSNGWYNGSIEDNFPFGFVATNYPTFAVDTNHGYAADQYLLEDGGTLLPMNLDLEAVLSISQAQRLAKMALLRNRQQGSGTLIFGPAGYNLQPNDTFTMTFPQRGWANKLLEVTSTQFVLDKDERGAPMIKVIVGVQDTAASVYDDLQAGEELLPTDVPAAPESGMYATAAPTNVQLISGAPSALVNADGSVTPRIEVTWDTPEDIRVAHIQTQYRRTGASTWTDGGTVGVDSNLMFIAPIISGQSYDVQVRSLQPNGAASVWVTISGFATSSVISASTQTAIGPDGCLIGEAYDDGTAAIECATFTAQLGGRSVTYFPDEQTISGLAQQTAYDVYVVDPNLAGGDLTPVATTSPADYLGKLGYFLIGTIVTPYCGPSGAATRFLPSAASDTGTRTTSSPQCAYDNDLSTYASVSGSSNANYIGGRSKVTYARGSCSWNGFQPVVTSSAMTLYISVAASTYTEGGASDPTSALTVSIGGTASAVPGFGADMAKTLLSVAVPSGTDLSTVSVSAGVTPPLGLVADTNNPTVESSGSISLFEIYIQ